MTIQIIIVKLILVVDVVEQQLQGAVHDVF